ncbi:topoisomerase DNA-binding C4 zinc finger domain-containing protein [Sellimonas intestinalis]|uniref:topoisomerase DNA-binding C4 zinc finger domain-containing protein n=1 Tax=Sellimonas intestinalis TaxID=1653434 RepID=UPI0009E92121
MFNEKREEEFYELVGQGICPQCGSYLVIRNGKYGEFFECSNFPHCRFTFNYDENN